MRILIVAATEGEVGPMIAGLETSPVGLPSLSRDTNIRTLAHRGHALDVLVTGVGMVATAARVSQALASGPYDLAFNFGVCGSFDPAIGPGAVVHVIADRLAEQGAEDRDGFLTIQELQLVDGNDFPYSHGQIVNAQPPTNAALGRLPAVHGITVNTAHGRAESIARVTARFAPQVESMEGAAFMYSCLLAGVSFAQVRAVSNMVEPRDRANWRLAEAIEALGRTGLQVLAHA